MTLWVNGARPRVHIYLVSRMRFSPAHSILSYTHACGAGDDQPKHSSPLGLRAADE